MAALLLIGMVGAYTYMYVTKDKTALDLFGIPLPAQYIALWVVVPMVLLYLATFLHMAFYGLLNGMKFKKYEKDYDKLFDLILDSYLGKKDGKYEFKTSPYALLGRILQNSTIFPNGMISFREDNNKTKKAFEILEVIEDIKAGKVADLRPYNLPADNELVLQNNRNKYKTGEIAADVLLANSTNYDDDLRKEVYADLVKTTSLNAIEKYKTLITKESLFTILSRVNAEENTLELTNEFIISLMSMLKLTKDDYIEISKLLSNGNMTPDQRLKLFESLIENDDAAMYAYIYTLFDLEMISATDEILNNSQDDEFIKFKAYRALKDCDKNFSIDLFI
jgi:hypothetical protein